MSIVRNGVSHHILAFLFSCRSTSRYKRLLRADPNHLFDNNKLSIGLNRLRKSGCIDKNNDGWLITNKGREILSRVSSQYITSPFDSKSTKNTIISFDIPERDRKTRGWLRNQLKIFNFEMLQQSLWFGPGPLPKEFLSRIINLGIKKNVKIFTIKPR
jgi:DNA-binding transcriptional regulator PaaX